MPASKPSTTSNEDVHETPRNSAASDANVGDGLDKVELSDLESTPPPLPIESDLMQLARLGELRAIQKLFDSGRYNAKSTDEQGITALHWAAINGHVALCHFLLQSGADVNAKGGDAMATPVLWASKRFNLPVISLLLSHGADPLLRDDQGYNLLHSATLDGNVFQLTLLLHQADLPVDVQDSQGHTSLMWAAYKGFPACIDALLRFGADVHAVDDMGFTALHWALVKGSFPCIQKLIEHGSDRFVRSKPQGDEPEGDTPAMTAMKMKSEKQWHRALVNAGFDESGNPLSFPIPLVKDKRWFFKRFLFLWPFFLGGLQLYMLAHLVIWVSIPGVLLIGYALQYLVGKLLRWAPNDMKNLHHTPVLAGIFAGTLFWVGMCWLFRVLPTTFSSHPLLNISFLLSYILCTYFYASTMTSDPGFIPKAASRGLTKKTIDDLVEHNAFNEKHFCTQCMIRKPLRSKHCWRCKRCVAREDHHCPWVDNCVAVNNHKHFVLYVMFMILGIILFIQLTLAYITILPPPAVYECSILKDDYCAQLCKDPFVIVTCAWAGLQLTWTFMLLFVHFFQVSQNITTYENMRHAPDGGPLLAAVTSGTTSLEAANVVDGTGQTSSGGHSHPHPHKHVAAAKKPGLLSSWCALLGVDTFIAIAFQGYKGAQNKDKHKQHPRKTKPFSRGIFRNCQDFWCDGPIFGSKTNGKALLGGDTVDYTNMYEVPRKGMLYRGEYARVADGEEGAEV